MQIIITEDEKNYLQPMFDNFINKRIFLVTDILLSLIYETNVKWTYKKGTFTVKTQDNKILDTFDKKGWAKLIKENSIEYHIDTLFPRIYIKTANEHLEKNFLLLLDKLGIEYFESTSSEVERQMKYIDSVISELFED
jgi:hypothetical protein